MNKKYWTQQVTQSLKNQKKVHFVRKKYDVIFIWTENEWLCFSDF